ncbi:PH domain-containing protein [Catenulispora subtropica]|uniref:PH domain-containing protein n=1 Tax=Catenulispora subtropica TaxID=450798 RepID=UPI0031CF29FF
MKRTSVQVTDNHDRDRQVPGPPDPFALPVPETVPALPATFRPTRTRVAVFAVSAVLVVTLVVVALILPDTGPTAWSTPERVAFAAIGPLISAGLYLLARPRIVADERGVTVVNTVRTQHLEWAQIVRVNLRPGDPWVLLDLDSGEVLPAMGIQASGGRAARRAAGELRALVDEHTRTERDD